MNPLHSDSEYPSSQAGQSPVYFPLEYRKDAANISEQTSVPQGSQKRKARRTRTGCLTCRARKIKCDETAGRCDNCERVMLECLWPVMRSFSKASSSKKQEEHISSSHSSPQNFASYGANGSDVQRPTLLHPLKSTTKSNELAPKDPLLLEHGSLQEHEMENTSSNISGIGNIPLHILDEHIEGFFVYVYPCQGNAFLHRGTLLRDAKSGQVSKMLQLAICAIASPFLPSRRCDPAQVQDWARAAKTMLILEDEMTLDTVATALLLAKNDINSGRYGSAWKLSSVASRAVMALGLHKEEGDYSFHNRSSWVEQETRRRLFWACYCLDRMMSTGIPEFALIRSEQIRMHLPCEEHQYLLGIDCETPILDHQVEIPGAGSGMMDQGPAEQKIGLFGQYVRMIGMRFMILKCVRNGNDGAAEFPPWDVRSNFVQCVKKLSSWRSSLPPQFQLLSETIYARQAQNQLTPLIMLHVWYDHCLSDLYRISMPGFPESLLSSTLMKAPAGWVQQHQLACVRHARNIGSTFEILSRHVDEISFVFLDASLPICIFESMRVQLQWLFMLPAESQAERIMDITHMFHMFTQFMERMAKYFRQAEWLLKEMRQMLLRHGFDIHGDLGPFNKESSGSESPQHPWLQRIQELKKNLSNASTNETPEAERMIQPDTRTVYNPLNVESGSASAFSTFNQITSYSSDNYELWEQENLFQSEDMMNLMAGYNQEPNFPNLDGFSGIHPQWTAQGYEGEGEDDVM